MASTVVIKDTLTAEDQVSTAGKYICLQDSLNGLALNGLALPAHAVQLQLLYDQAVTTSSLHLQHASKHLLNRHIQLRALPISTALLACASSRCSM